MDFGGILAGAVAGGAGGYLEEHKRAMEAKRAANLQRLADLGADLRSEKQNQFTAGQTDKAIAASKDVAKQSQEWKTKESWDNAGSGMYNGTKELTNKQVSLLNPEEFNNLRDQTGYDEMVSKNATETEKSKRDFEMSKIDQQGQNAIATANARNEGKGKGLLSDKIDTKKIVIDEANAFKDIEASARAMGFTLEYGDKRGEVDENGDPILGTGDLQSIQIPYKDFLTTTRAIKNKGINVTSSFEKENIDGQDYITLYVGAYDPALVGTLPPAQGELDDYTIGDKNKTTGEIPSDTKASHTPFKPTEEKEPILGKSKSTTPTQEEVASAIKNVPVIKKGSKTGSPVKEAGKDQNAIKNKFTEIKAEQIPYVMEINGEKVEVPLLVPQQDGPARAHLKAGKPPTQEMIDKARVYAEYRKKKGLPYFREVTE